MNLSLVTFRAILLVARFKFITTSKTQVVSMPIIPQLPDSLQIGIVCLRARSFLLLKLWLGSSSVPVILGLGSLLGSLLDLGN